MAALKNHGREVARIVHSAKVGETDYRVTLSFRSDGHIMRRLVALAIHDTHYGASPDHDYGWKLYKRLTLGGKPQRDPARIEAWSTALAGRLDAHDSLISHTSSVL